jgi:hypothetical protein
MQELYMFLPMFLGSFQVSTHSAMKHFPLLLVTQTCSFKVL